jgi:cytochrome b involved in lipid metabolism
MDLKLLERDEVAHHSTSSSCWVIIHGTVFDVTAFIEDHPGGRSVILRTGGKDATEAFDAVHSMDLLERYKARLWVPKLESQSCNCC